MIKILNHKIDYDCQAICLGPDFFVKIRRYACVCDVVYL